MTAIFACGASICIVEFWLTLSPPPPLTPAHSTAGGVQRRYSASSSQDGEADVTRSATRRCVRGITGRSRRGHTEYGGTVHGGTCPIYLHTHHHLLTFHTPSLYTSSLKLHTYFTSYTPSHSQGTHPHIHRVLTLTLYTPTHHTHPHIIHTLTSYTPHHTHPTYAYVYNTPQTTRVVGRRNLIITFTISPPPPHTHTHMYSVWSKCAQAMWASGTTQLWDQPETTVRRSEGNGSHRRQTQTKAIGRSLITTAWCKLSFRITLATTEEVIKGIIYRVRHPWKIASKLLNSSLHITTCTHYSMYQLYCVNNCIHAPEQKKVKW